MTPTSLLTLPADTLRDAARNGHLQSPHGERQERLFALAVALITLAAPIGALLLG